MIFSLYPAAILWSNLQCLRAETNRLRGNLSRRDNNINALDGVAGPIVEKGKQQKVLLHQLLEMYFSLAASSQKRGTFEGLEWGLS